MRGPAILALLGLGAVGLAVFGEDPLETGPAIDIGPSSSMEDGIPRDIETPESCAGCHRGRQPGLLAQWDESVHVAEGVRCEDCHGDDHEWLHARG